MHQNSICITFLPLLSFINYPIYIFFGCITIFAKIFQLNIMRHNIFKLYPGGEMAPPNVSKIGTLKTHATT